MHGDHEKFDKIQVVKYVLKTELETRYIFYLLVQKCRPILHFSCVIATVQY